MFRLANRDYNSLKFGRPEAIEMTRNRKVTTIFSLALGDTGDDPASEVWRTAHMVVYGTI